MESVLIVAIVFSFIAFSSYLDYNRKRERDKINAALRMEEMRRGYKPGTYSDYSVRRSRRNRRKHNKNDDFIPEFNTNIREERKKERADLKEGIDDLMTRINNLEVIMEDEKNKKGE
eukprot:Anaeramoba_ignava/a89814_60.p5 GENE.a89814_60~~a89814_60.p5  ORF type:complete len:117 (-),score=29.27 a89814_60:1266-1616(-)